MTERLPLKPRVLSLEDPVDLLRLAEGANPFIACSAVLDRQVVTNDMGLLIGGSQDQPTCLFLFGRSGSPSRDKRHGVVDWGIPGSTDVSFPVSDASPRSRAMDLARRSMDGALPSLEAPAWSFSIRPTGERGSGQPRCWRRSQIGGETDHSSCGSGLFYRPRIRAVTLPVLGGLGRGGRYPGPERTDPTRSR